MHIEKYDAYTNGNCLYATNIFTKLYACIYAYMNKLVSYTLTHTHGHRCTSTRTITHTSKHIYANAHKHVSTPTHILHS